MESRFIIMKVYNAEPDNYSEVAINAWLRHGIKYIRGNWSEVEKSCPIVGVDILIVRLAKFINSEVLDFFPNLKYILSSTTGLDHLDLEEISRRGIKVFSLRGHNEFLSTISSTAELTFALILSLLRNIPAANDDVRCLNWRRDKFRGYQLFGKIIGIIGMGRIGSKVASYSKAFGMNVKYFDPNVINYEYEKCLELNELLSNSDIISLHVHLSDETKNLINKNNIKYIRKDAYLINTSRGAIWDEKELTKALTDKRISGIATDVIFNELNDISNCPLIKAQKDGLNVIITPHIGGATYDAMKLCEEFIVSNFINDE